MSINFPVARFVQNFRQLKRRELYDGDDEIAEW